MKYRPADDNEINTFVKTAVDKLKSKGMDDIEAVCRLAAGLSKHAERLGILEDPIEESRRRIEVFKKKASDVLSNLK